MEILNDNQPTVLHSVDAMAVVDLVIACDGGVAVWLCECHGHDNVCCGRWMNVVNLAIGTSVAVDVALRLRYCAYCGSLSVGRLSAGRCCAPSKMIIQTPPTGIII